MATYTDALGFPKGSTAAYRAAGENKVSVQSVTINWATVTTARAAAGVAALAANDIVEVLRIPAKTFVMRAGIDVTTADGTALTLHLGDGSDDDGYVTSLNGNAVGSATNAFTLTEAAPNTVTGYSGGKYYSAADTIDIKMITAPLDAAVLTVWAVVANCG